jgi:hypothetical protein
MSVVKIFEGKNNAFILPHFMESKTLRDLRTQLTLDGFIPPNNYQFVFGRVLVFTAQLSVKAVATQESTTSDGRKILRVQTVGSTREEPVKAAQSKGHSACIEDSE